MVHCKSIHYASMGEGLTKRKLTSTSTFPLSQLGLEIPHISLDPPLWVTALLRSFLAPSKKVLHMAFRGAARKPKIEFEIWAKRRRGKEEAANRGNCLQSYAHVISALLPRFSSLTRWVQFSQLMVSTASFLGPRLWAFELDWGHPRNGSKANK